MESFRILVVSEDDLFAASVQVVIGTHHDIAHSPSEADAVELLRAGARYTTIIVDSSRHTGTELMGGLLVHAPEQASRVLLVSFDGTERQAAEAPPHLRM